MRYQTGNKLSGTRAREGQGGLLELPPNLEEVNLGKILHKSNLGGLLGLPANWPGVAGNSGQLAGI